MCCCAMFFFSGYKLLCSANSWVLPLAWEQPPPDVVKVKVNYNASVTAFRLNGFGCIVRDANGETITMATSAS